jgi:hypothetical protein
MVAGTGMPSRPSTEHRHEVVVIESPAAIDRFWIRFAALRAALVIVGEFVRPGVP